MNRPFIPHVCFDFVQAENAFQRVKPASQSEEKLLNEVWIVNSITNITCLKYSNEKILNLKLFLT